MSFGYYNSPIGKIKIDTEDNYIVGVNFVRKEEVEIKEDNISNDIVNKCKKQLDEYFNNERKEFDLEIKFLKGTEFQRKVWNELIKIPYGETVTYKEIAKRISNPNAVRAVGGANNKNPIAIIVPCHRVIGSSGKLIGYADGIDKKDYLLKLENKNI